MKTENENTKIKGKKGCGPYSCEELAAILNAGEKMDFDRFMGFLVLVTAVIGELEGRLDSEPIQNWIEDEKAKIKALLYKANHQDCYRWFKASAPLIAQTCEGAIEHLKAAKPTQGTLDRAVMDFEKIRDAVFNETSQKEGES